VNTAVGHLVAAGHRRVAFVSGPLTLSQCRDRLDGGAADGAMTPLSEVFHLD
jgi:DNA-binding LacI/PurR family transcriptional regulator